MASITGNPTPAIVIHAPAETSDSETITHTQQTSIEQARATDEQEVVAVDANVQDISPEAVEDFNEETTEGITQDIEAESTRDSKCSNEKATEGVSQDDKAESTSDSKCFNEKAIERITQEDKAQSTGDHHGPVVDRVTGVNRSSVSSNPSLGTSTGPLQIEPAESDQMVVVDRVTGVNQSAMWSSPSLSTNTGLLQVEPTEGNQMEVTGRVPDVARRSVSSTSSYSTDRETNWTEPVVDVLNWIDHSPNRRTRGVRSSTWQQGYRAGMRATMTAVSDYGHVADVNLSPPPLFSNSPPALRRGRRAESTSEDVGAIRRETSQEQAEISDTVTELATNTAGISATAPPAHVTPPFVVLTTTPGRHRVTSILATHSPPSPSLAGLTASPSAPLVATNENLSRMEYAKATEDVNDMRRFGDEGGEDEVVPGGLVRGSPVGGYPKRRSSVLRRVNAGRGGRESALYQSSLTKAVEEENSGRMAEIMETLRTSAERSGGGIRKLFKKGKRMLSKLLN